MSAESVRPVELFYSYAHEDELLRQGLEKHLASLKRQGFIAGWHSRNISSGTEWVSKIDTHLNTARIILLLISPDFMASDYCYSIEMKRVMERHEAGEARVIPIILRPVDWNEAPFARLLALPGNAKPVTRWSNQDEAFLDIVRGIRKAIAEPTASSSPVLAPSSLIWNVPFRRNPFFTGREELLTALYYQLQSEKPAALTQPLAISGLGGIGKTQIAVEYAYRYRDEYRAVLWVNAATRETLIASFIELAGLLKLPERDEKDQRIVVAAVKHWLESHTNWLLILDSADDLQMVDDFVPTGGRGHVLLTTRAQSVGAFARSVPVEEMKREEGIHLLLRRAGLLKTNVPLEGTAVAERAAADALVQAAGGLPLALDQAGAYIEETGCSLSDYLQLYQTYRRELLQRRGGLVPDYTQPVGTTWSLSFAKVEQASPAAADLLRLCAFLDPDAIPEEIFTDGASDLGPALGEAAAHPFVLDEAIGELRRFSLIRRNPDMKLLNIHRLVQAVLKDGMSEEMQHQWAERAVRVVNRNFPNPQDVATWARCQLYLPHAMVCAAFIQQWDMTFAEAMLLLNHTGSYLNERAQYVVAEQIIERALAINERVLGPSHPDVATNLNNLALIYDDQGKYEQAEPLLQRALTIREKVLGSNHPKVATSLNNLATHYYHQGEYQQAEALYQRALTINERILGPNHPGVATNLNNLAELYHIQDKYKQAEPLYHCAHVAEKTLPQGRGITGVM